MSWHGDATIPPDALKRRSITLVNLLWRNNGAESLAGQKTAI